MNIMKALTLLAAATLLSACGDNPEGAPGNAPPSTEVPATAAASTRAWAQFAASLPINDTQEPLDVNKVSAPTSETDDPQAI